MSACVSGLLEGLSYISLDAFLRGTTMPAAILGLALAGLALGHDGGRTSRYVIPVRSYRGFALVPYVS